MSSQNYLIKLEEIENSPGKTLIIDFEDEICEIKTKSPIKARFELKSLGSFIEVTGSANCTAILECDLCLEKYEYDCDIEIEEVYSKTKLLDQYGQETELKDGQFITDLNGANFIDIYDLLYQSVILDFPNKKVCGINCKGGDIFIRDENPQNREPDPRLAIFKEININSNK